MSQIQTKNQAQKKSAFKQVFVAVSLLAFLSALFVYHLHITPKCDFFRGKACITCASEQEFPVGYKENCNKCPNKTAYYVEGGLTPAWLCLPKDSPLSEEAMIARNNTPCPRSAPLKDVVGNCYACTSVEPVRLLSHTDKHFPCRKERYLLPDHLTFKSLKCPTLNEIKDPEVCVACHGIWQGENCTKTGENAFCKTNEDCPENQWCFPFKIQLKHSGICTNQTENKWICSQTDGYDLEKTKNFCAGQNAHIPTLDEISTAEEDLSQLCPTLDMWTFFAPDGVVWMESFTQEFLFTREGESDKLGGHQFYALCHKD